MTETNKRFYSLQNAGVFSLVMGKKENCKEFIERALNMDIASIDVLEVEKSIEGGVDVRGVRLDVYVVDNKGNGYNIEMQVGSRYKEYLGRRARYYQAMADIGSLKKGQKYFELPQSYVIFVCVFDPFEENRKYYSFKNYCEQNQELELKDGATKVFLYTKGSVGTVSDELQNLFDYINTGKPNDAYTKQLEKDVVYANEDPNRREEFMTLQDEMDLANYVKQQDEAKIAEMKAEIAAKDSEIAAKDAEIAELKRLLAEKHKE